MEGRIKNGRLEEIVHVHLHIKYAGGNVCMCAVECSIHNNLLKPPMARNRSHTLQNTCNATAGCSSTTCTLRSGQG